MTNYQSTLEAYTEQLRGMFAPVSRPGAFTAPPRGGARPDAETLTGRAEHLAALGQELGRQHAEYLTADRQAVREAAEIKLLAQINAELAVASALLETAEQEMEAANTEAGFAGPEARQRRRRSRAAAGAATTRALDKLARAIEAPLEVGAQAFGARAAMREDRPTNQADACKALADKTKRSLRTIASQAALTGSEALDTLFSLDAEMVGKAVGLVSKEAGELLDKAITGATALIKRIISAAATLLLQAYDLVLSLLGKDTEAAARKKVQEWIEELRGEYKQGGEREGLASKLVNQIFATEGVESDVKGWLAQTQADFGEINDTTDKVEKLAAAYEVKTKQVKDTLNVVRVTRGIARGAALKFPPVATALPYLELIAGAVTTGLLGYTLFTGYDHVDSGQAVFFERFAVKIPDRVAGIRRVTKKVLVKE